MTVKNSNYFETVSHFGNGLWPDFVPCCFGSRRFRPQSGQNILIAKPTQKISKKNYPPPPKKKKKIKT